ncbi:hypothetical protein AHAS_Ahas11G0200000 [Arachis hypogaea]
MSSLTSSSVHVGWSKSKLNGLGQIGSSLMASVASLDSTIGLRFMPELLGLDAPVPVAFDAGSEGEVTQFRLEAEAIGRVDCGGETERAAGEREIDC